MMYVVTNVTPTKHAEGALVSASMDWLRMTSCLHSVDTDSNRMGQAYHHIDHRIARLSDLMRFSCRKELK